MSACFDAAGLTTRDSSSRASTTASVWGLDSVVSPSSVSVPADQPITNEAATVQLVFNGEIYNYRRVAAGAAGSRAPVRDQRRHRSDRPPLRGGRAPAASERLNGMFALRALGFDTSESARSGATASGRKPLYYASSDAHWSSAQSSKSILRPEVPQRLDYESLLDTSPSSTCPSPRSIIRGVREAARGDTFCVARAADRRRVVLGPLVCSATADPQTDERVTPRVPANIFGRPSVDA